ncbi:hypothetical protein Esti_004192 [Eimeria stiedai]
MEASVVSAPQHQGLKCGFSSNQLLLQQELLHRQQLLLQQQQAIQQQALLRDQQLWQLQQKPGPRQQQAEQQQQLTQQQEQQLVQQQHQEAEQQLQQQQPVQQQNQHQAEHQQVQQHQGRREQQQEPQHQEPQQHPQQQQQQHRGYSACGGEDGVLPAGPLFVEKMSLLMEQLATCGDEASRRPSVATRFDSVCAPATSIASYIPRLYRHFRCSEEVFVFALIYLDRVIRANNIKINALNIHRLVLAASVIGVKFVEDVRYSNRYYARVGGVGLAELNRLELAFLKLVKFDLTVSKEEYTVYRSTVLLACPKRPVAAAASPDQQQQQQQMLQGEAPPTEGVKSMDADGAVQSEAAGTATQHLPSKPVSSQQQQHKQQQQQQRLKAPQGLVTISTASTVSTTPDASGPYFSSGASCIAVAAPSVAQHQQQQQPQQQQQQDKEQADREAVAQKRALLQQQEDAYRLQLLQQRQQQALEQQQQQQQQTRLVLETQQHACWECAMVSYPKLGKQEGCVCSQERLMELQQQQQQQQQQRQLIRAQQLMLLREYHQQQQQLLEQQQQQQLHLLRQQQLLLQGGGLMLNEASLSPCNSFTPTSRSDSRESFPFCPNFVGDSEDRLTTAGPEEELLDLTSPVGGGLQQHLMTGWCAVNHRWKGG